MQVDARDAGLARGARAQQATQLRGEGIRGRDAGARSPGDRGERAVLRRFGEARQVFRGVFDHVEAQAVETPEADEQIGGARRGVPLRCRLRGIGVTWPASPLTTRCCSQSPMTPPEPLVDVRGRAARRHAAQHRDRGGRGARVGDVADAHANRERTAARRRAAAADAHARAALR